MKTFRQEHLLEQIFDGLFAHRSVPRADYLNLAHDLFGDIKSPVAKRCAADLIDLAVKAGVVVRDENGWVRPNQDNRQDEETGSSHDDGNIEANYQEFREALLETARSFNTRANGWHLGRCGLVFAELAGWTMVNYCRYFPDSVTGGLAEQATTLLEIVARSVEEARDYHEVRVELDWEKMARTLRKMGGADSEN